MSPDGMFSQDGDFQPNPQQAGQINTDRTIQLLTEAAYRKDFLYRTLFGTKFLPQVVNQIEMITMYYPIVNPVRQRTLSMFYELYKNTLISTTSIDGKTMNLLTETRIKHTSEDKHILAGGGGGHKGGGGGQQGGGGGMFG